MPTKQKEDYRFMVDHGPRDLSRSIQALFSAIHPLTGRQGTAVR